MTVKTQKWIQEIMNQGLPDEVRNVSKDDHQEVLGKIKIKPCY